VELTVSRAEHGALDALRGLPHSAHMLVMCSRTTPTGGILDGSEEAFEELVSFIGEEMADGTLSASSSRTLYSLCVRIDPSCRDWLGM